MILMKKEKDTRNNWITFMFKCKYAYYCFRKQSVIDTCTAALKDHERFGFKFDKIGFAGNHVHFLADIPKKYSIEVAEIMMKSNTSKKIFEKHPGFRKRYPRGQFWSGYEHHESTGRKDIKASRKYIEKQQEHHGIKVIDDKNRTLTSFFSDARGYGNA